MNSIYLRSLRIFGSLPMVDLEKGKIRLENRSEIHSPSIDESVPSSVGDGSRERRNSFEDRELGIQLTFDRREYSDEKGEKLTSVLLRDFRHFLILFCNSVLLESAFPPWFQSSSRIDLENGKIQFKKEKRSSLTIDR